MRITKELLLKTAHQAAEKQVKLNRQLVCIYLTGSLLTDEPLLGHTTDIDLVFIHSGEPPENREIIPVHDDIHLDIAHVSQNIFRQPRSLRGHPWIAPFLCWNPICLHDTRHWFEFTQAAVCSQINRSEYVYQRALTLAEQARESWMDLSMGDEVPFEKKINRYFNILFNSANSIASLNGIPLTERRFLLLFPQRAAMINRPGLAAGLEDLFTDSGEYKSRLEEWMKNWLAALDTVAQKKYPPHLHPDRKNYLFNAADVLKEDYPTASLWILLRSWNSCAAFLAEKSPEKQAWNEAVTFLGLGEENISERLKALDAYLDTVEETLDTWAENHGLK